MSAASLSFTGGLLQGLGTGMIAQAEGRRREALAMLELNRRDKQHSDELAARSAERADDRSYEAQQKSEERSYLGAEKANERAYQEGRDTAKYKHEKEVAGIRTGATAKDASGLSAGDNRELEKIIAANTTTTTGGINPTPRFDRATAEAALRRRGREDLIDFLPAESRGPLADDPDWIASEADAEKATKEKATWRHTDKTDFKDYGGSPTEFKNRKTKEFYDLRKGKAQGTGTQENPAKPTTQAELDALPVGAVFLNPSDGQLYRKK